MNRGQHCPGSGLHPTMRYFNRPRGKCRVCGGWFALSAGTRVFTHAYKTQQLHLSTRAAA